MNVFGSVGYLQCPSYDRGSHPVRHVYVAVAAHFALLLPFGARLHVGPEVLNGERGGSSRWPQTGAAAFGYGGAAEVVAGRGAFDPFGFTAAGLPLNPLPVQRCLGLRMKENIHYKRPSRFFFETFRFHCTSALQKHTMIATASPCKKDTVHHNGIKNQGCRYVCRVWLRSGSQDPVILHSRCGIVF